MEDSLLANGFFEERRQPLTYLGLERIRLPLTTLSLDTAVSNFKQIVKLRSAVPGDEAEEFVILAYMEKTGIYQKLREVLYDTYYGKKFPNPLPRICNRIEEFNRKFSEVILSKQMIDEELFRADVTVSEAVCAGRKIQDYYWASKQILPSEPGRRRSQPFSNVWNTSSHSVFAHPKLRHHPVLYGRAKLEEHLSFSRRRIFFH